MHSKLEWGSLILVVICGALVLFRTSYDASSLEVVPDSVEYAFGALNLASGEGYHIQVGGRDLPPRYPPWFSAALVPAYWLFGSDPGNGVYLVFGFSLIGLIAAFELGRRMTGIWGGAGAGMVLLAATDYHYWGRQIMTDVPCTACILTLLWIWMVLQKQRLRRLWVLAGIILALGTAFRPTTFAFVLPFIFTWVRRPPRRPIDLILLLTPLAILLGFSVGFNLMTFESFVRSGYNFWCAIPYDYPDLVYSLQHVLNNIQQVRDSNLIWLSLAVLALWALRRKQENATFRLAIIYAFLGGLPFLLFYLVYFYPDARFYLPLAALMAVACGGLLGAAGRRFPAWLLIAIQAGLVFFAYWMTGHVRPRPDYSRREMADAIVRELPLSAAVITAIDPVYLENFPGMGKRQIIPVSRRVEYASKVLTRMKIPEQCVKPQGWWDHRCQGLLAGGAEEAIPWVAMDEPGRITDLLASGRPVLIDKSSVSGACAAEIARLADADIAAAPVAGFWNMASK